MKKPTCWLLLLILLFPLFQAYIYFDVMAAWSPMVQKTTYSITKILMFVFPAVYLGLILKEKMRLRPLNDRGLAEGTYFGLLVLVGICLLYYCYFKPLGIIAPGTSVAEQISKKVTSFGIITPAPFLLFGCFVSFIHSGLEEYYWRWFAFGQLKRVCSKYPAMVISGIAFSLHHIIILGTYFGYTSQWTWLFSLGIAIGGFYWCWLYQRKDSIWASWLSHAWVDIAIFIVGYDLIFNKM